MAKLEILAGTTSKMVSVFLQDSSSTTGAGLTGLVFNTASLSAYYYREGAGSSTAISLATMTLGTWATSGFVVVDGTNMPGMYSLGLPNAAIAAGAKSVTVYIKGATNLMPCVLEIELTATDNQDTVRYGLTALPNVASGSAGAIPTTGTGANQLSVSSGLVTLAGVTHTGAVIPTVITTTTATNLTNAPTNGDLTATMKTSVTTACTASTPVAASVTGAVGSVTGNVGGNVVGSVASVTTVSANAIGATSISSAGLNAIADGVLDRNMATGTDSGTDSTAVRTLRQAARASRNKTSISAGTMTVTKEDDVTASWTASVSTSAGNPLSSVDPT